MCINRHIAMLDKLMHQVQAARLGKLTGGIVDLAR